MCLTERNIDFAKGKAQVVKIGGNGSTQNTGGKIPKPPPTTIQTDLSRKWHEGAKGGQGKPGN